VTPFETWCNSLGVSEGGMSVDPRDPGNFRPDGTLVGTKFGISARAHPTVDIPNLTLEQANELRKTEYWDKVRGDELPGPVAFVLAEAAYGSGYGTAIKQMQEVVGVPQDGAFGPGTMKALTASTGTAVQVEAFCVEYSSQRLMHIASLDIWPTYKLGWTRRLFRGLQIALDMMLVPAAPVEVPVVAEPLPAPAPVPVALLGEGTWDLTVTVKRAA
jgi:lysozyme family protein